MTKILAQVFSERPHSNSKQQNHIHKHNIHITQSLTRTHTHISICSKQSREFIFCDTITKEPSRQKYVSDAWLNVDRRAPCILANELHTDSEQLNCSINHKSTKHRSNSHSHSKYKSIYIVFVHYTFYFTAMQTWYFAKNSNDLASYFDAQFAFYFGIFSKNKKKLREFWDSLSFLS